MSMTERESDLQRRYYAETADSYERLHVRSDDEHAFALAFMVAAIDFLGVESLLDIGSGTGRALLHVRAVRPALRLAGIEPVCQLREIAFQKGLSPAELMGGDATALPFDNGEFDLVSAFGVLHHVRNPNDVVAEMLRVSRKAIFISDANNFGQGGPVVRGIKQIIHRIGLWPLANFLKTGGRGYSVSPEDGIAYSYSVFSSYDMITESCRGVHLLNTKGGSADFYRTASHVALLGIR